MLEGKVAVVYGAGGGSLFSRLVTRKPRARLKRASSLAEVAIAAVIMASDYASAMTATVANASGGELVD